MTYGDNISVLDGTAKTIFSDMCTVWETVGETVNRDLLNTLYDSSYIETLSSKYDANDVTSTDKDVVVTEDNEDDVLNTEALLQKSVTINFVANTAKFLDSSEATKSLQEFIDIAKTLDGAIIQIEGNIASDNDDADGVALSKQRAETVKQYFIMNGISADRIVSVGNGGTKPVAPNDSEENMEKNRRTDISFKLVEQ